MSIESEPKPRIEERILIKLGYEHCLDVPLEDGVSTTGRNFLDMYKNPEMRQETEDLLYGFAEMPETDPDYEATKTYITRYIEPYFGSPN